MRACFAAVTLLVLGISGCDISDGGENFSRIFGFELPKGISVEQKTGRHKIDKIFVANITDKQFEEVKARAISAGYSEWRKMDNTETYGQEDFFIESTEAAPILEAIRKTPRGDVFRLFYIRSHSELSAVAFYN